MKKITLLICSLAYLLIASPYANAQGWEKTYGDSIWDTGESVQQTKDGGYIIIGNTSNSPGLFMGIYLIKTNVNGDTLWTKTFIRGMEIFGYSVQQTKDGGYIISGTTGDVFLIKTDTNGDTLWTKTYGNSGYDVGNSVQNTVDGGYIITGSTSSFGGKQDVYLIKTDAKGDTLWTKTYGGAFYDVGNSVQNTVDGGYIITGSTTSFGNGKEDAYLIKTDAKGDTLWTKTYGGSSDDDGACVRQTTDKGYIIAGTTLLSSNNHAIYLIKTNDNGDTLWTRTFGGISTNDAGFSVQQTKDGGYVIVGYTQVAQQNEYGYIIKTNVKGDTLWTKRCYTGVGKSVQQTIDTGYIIAGYTNKFMRGGYDVYLIKTDSLGNSLTNIISGKVFNDQNNNCKKDNGEKALKNRIIKITPWSQYATTDSNGYYSAVVDTGTYTISVFNPSPYWKTTCPSTPNNYTVNLPAFYDTSATNDFGSKIEIYCPLMWVDVSTSLVRACRQNTYAVNYCNKGTADAANSYITIEFDKNIIPLKSSLAWSSKNGNTYTFNLGTVKEGECGSFYITDSVNCNAVMGSTVCVKAKIYPDTICTATDSSWDKSSISLTRACMNDSIVRFVIYNTGQSMTGTSEYRIYTNNGLSFTKKFQLAGGDSLIVDIIANGNSIRLEADQRTGHPGNSHPNETVEGCGHNQAAARMIGLVNSVPQDDADEFVAIDCQTVRASYDPNEKLVVPTGITANNYISAKNELEYQIGFQNTGNDTAFLVVVRDTLPASLEVTSVVSGSSSHPYTFRIYGQGILEWTFKNILLVDSITNEPKSHGFVKYRIKQKANNPKGTVIANRAAIYFDYNAPVITNAATNTVYDTIIALGINNPRTYTTEATMFIYPNPFTNTTTISIDYPYIEKSEIAVYDIIGKKIKSYPLQKGQNQITVSSNEIGNGIYICQFTVNGKTLATKKMVVIK